MKLPVAEKKYRILQEQMTRLGIRESDLEETFVRSGGPGGQNVNKVSTCVVLKHRPSGLAVKCQKDRSQVLNRYYARQLLVQKLEAQIHGHRSEEARRIAKIRKQKRKRSKRAKDKILEGKRHQSSIKQLRSKLRASEFS